MEESSEKVDISRVLKSQEASPRRRARNFTQFNVYKDMSTLKNVIVDYMGRCPRRFTKFFDLMLSAITEAKKLIGFADISRNSEERCWYISCAKVTVLELMDDLTTLHRVGQMGTDEWKKMRSLVASIGQQLQAMMAAYNTSQGVIQK